MLHRLFKVNFVVSFVVAGSTLVAGSILAAERQPMERDAIKHFRLDSDASVNTIEVSSDGKLVAVAEDRGNVHVWDISSGKELLKARTGSKNFRECNSVAFTHDGLHAVYCSAPNCISFWNVKKGREDKKITLPKGSVLSFAFSAALSEET